MIDSSFAPWLLALIALYFVLGVGLFILAIMSFVMALGHGNKEPLPSHLKFNPLNILINEASLDQYGKKYRKRGIQYLLWFFLLAVIGIIFQTVLQFIVK